MADWGTQDLSAALPAISRPVEGTDAVPKVNPQDHGWAERTAYDYITYNKSSKELLGGQSNGGAQAAGVNYGAAGSIEVSDWASNGAVYEWSDEYGEIGPAFPDLENQLFGSECHVKSGLEFDR
jgi:ATP-dependent RNA helicase DDX3X